MHYSPSEWIKNCYSLVLTKLFYRPARLIRRPIYIRGRKGFEFHKGFTTGYGCRIEIFSKKDEKTLKIGDNCKIGDRVHIVASESVVIGSDCLMASHIFISDTNHGDNFSDPTVPPDERPLTTSPVSIGNQVWIGEGAAILPGATIGNGCIVGAHAVVKGQIPDYCIVAGAPAKVIKKYNFESKQWERA